MGLVGATCMSSTSPGWAAALLVLELRSGKPGEARGVSGQIPQGFHPCVSGCCSVQTFCVLIPYFQLLLNGALQMQQGALRQPKEAFLKVVSGEATLQAKLQSSECCITLSLVCFLTLLAVVREQCRFPRGGWWSARWFAHSCVRLQRIKLSSGR